MDSKVDWPGSPGRAARQFCLLTVLGLTGCQAPAPLAGACKLALVTEVPLRPVDGGLRVEVLLDGKKTEFELATASTSTILNTAAQNRLGLYAYPSGWTSVGIGGRKELGLVRTKTFQLGALQSEHLHVFTGDLWTRRLSRHADGVLGTDILSQYDVELNLGTMNARLYAASGDCSAPTASIAPPLYTVPLIASGSVEDKRPMVHVTIGAQELTALIDTSIPYSAIFYTSVRRLGFKASDFEQDSSVTEPDEEPHSMRKKIHLFESVGIGPLTLRNAPIRILNRPSNGGYDMFLGADFLARVHTWISYSSRTLIMQYPLQASQPPT